MRKWAFVALFSAAIPLGYVLRGSIGREKFMWLIAGLLSFMLVFHLVRLGLRRYVKAQEGRMLPAERQAFEEYKRQHSDGDKVK